MALTKIDIAPKNVAKETLQAIRQSLRRCTSHSFNVYVSKHSPTKLLFIYLLICRRQDGDAREDA